MRKINKNVCLKGKSIYLRAVALEDVNFVYQMRNNQKKTKFLNKVEGSLEDQKKWLRQCINDPYQIYFIICSLNHEPCGLIRLYDQKGDSFCWGSWLITEDAHPYTAIESALLLYHYALDDLGFKKSHFDVRIGNNKVIAFHKKFGAKEIKNDEQNIYFEISEEIIRNSLKKYSRFL